MAKSQANINEAARRLIGLKKEVILALTFSIQD
jgi:hypothetical protein